MAEQPKQKTSNQHTVPRCYLKRFASDKLRFFAFNKSFQKSREIGTRSATVQEDFYDLHPSTLVGPGTDMQWVETTFSKLEGRYEQVLSAAISEATAGRISVDTGSSLAQFMTLQWLRTVGMRKSLLDADAMMKKELIEAWYAEHAPGVPLPKFVREEGYEAAFHANVMFDRDTIFGLAQRFWDLYWIVGRNKTSQPFYTSDDPVILDRIAPLNEGPEVPPWIGIEYAFPLNSEFILVMMDRYMVSKTMNTNGVNYERVTVDMDDTTVDRYNALQVAKSTHYVFCQENKFELAERLCKEEPQICSPDRSRELIDTTTLKYDNGKWSIVIFPLH
ncbi:hypothetical protein BH11PLA2_BH11PLA2_41610 [soil metagenome]